jgi:hypothetical protein
MANAVVGFAQKPNVIALNGLWLCVEPGVAEVDVDIFFFTGVTSLIL